MPNSKGFVNFVMSNLRNFEKFYTLKMLKNSYFLYGEKTLDFPIKLAFFIISTTSYVSKYIQQMQRGKLNRISVFRNICGSRNDEKS
jgi:hypothetical protein